MSEPRLFLVPFFQVRVRKDKTGESNMELANRFSVMRPTGENTIYIPVS